MGLAFILRLALGVLLADAANFAAEQAPETQTNAVPATNTYRIAPGVIHRFSLPIIPAARRSIVASKNPMVETVTAGIAVPFGFNPEIPNPILIVSASSDGNGSSVDAMRAYTNAAFRLGFVVLAADGAFGKPLHDSPPWRWAMISTLLEHVNKTWPSSRKWPVVAAGFSGGGKMSGLLGGMLSHNRYNLIGVFMAGVNQDFASEAGKIYHPATRYKKVPIFLSSGRDDDLATPLHHADIRENLRANGFTKVRLETFSGRHELNIPALIVALRWFIQEYSMPSDSEPVLESPLSGAP